MEATSSRPDPFFIANSIALDFANSKGVIHGEEIEWISNGVDLVAWLKLSGLVNQDVIDEIEISALPGELDSVADAARTLRTWFCKFVAEHRGKSLTPRALAQLGPLNDLLKRDETYLEVRPRGRSFGKSKRSKSVMEAIRKRRWRTPSSLLIPLGESMAELISSSNFAKVKKCYSSACTLLFDGTNERRARRWCSMSLCGNRAKQRAHNHRIQRLARSRK